MPLQFLFLAFKYYVIKKTRLKFFLNNIYKYTYTLFKNTNFKLKVTEKKNKLIAIYSFQKYYLELNKKVTAL